MLRNPLRHRFRLLGIGGWGGRIRMQTWNLDTRALSVTRSRGNPHRAPRERVCQGGKHWSCRGESSAIRRNKPEEFICKSLWWKERMKASMPPCSPIGRAGLPTINEDRAAGWAEGGCVQSQNSFPYRREGRAFLKEDAIDFFIGDADPGHSTTFQSNLSAFLFHRVLLQISPFSLNRVTDCKHISGTGTMDASLDSAFHQGLPLRWFHELYISRQPARKSANVKSYLQAGIIQAESTKRGQRQTGRVQESGQGNEGAGEHWFSRRMLRWVGRNAGSNASCTSWHGFGVKADRAIRHGSAWQLRVLELWSRTVRPAPPHFSCATSIINATSAS